MASDFKPKNTIHTLFKDEVPIKMCTYKKDSYAAIKNLLPVGDLFMVRRASAEKLHKFNIHTIGELAQYDVNLLTCKLHSHGKLKKNYSEEIYR